MRRRFWWHTPLQRALNRLSQRDQARFTEWTTQQFDRERQALVVEANRNDNRRESGHRANRVVPGPVIRAADHRRAERLHWIDKRVDLRPLHRRHESRANLALRSEERR